MGPLSSSFPGQNNTFFFFIFSSSHSHLLRLFFLIRLAIMNDALRLRIFCTRPSSYTGLKMGHHDVTVAYEIGITRQHSSFALIFDALFFALDPFRYPFSRIHLSLPLPFPFGGYSYPYNPIYAQTCTLMHLSAPPAHGRSPPLKLF